MYFVYVIQNPKGQLYKGSTSDIEKRLYCHNEGLSRWTKNKGPWYLVHREEFATKTEALK
ncbi:MAG: GIY-YIG nuclease family protein [bacterium]|nr:GIY-YIG nuclease family protein [bacterium]